MNKKDRSRDWIRPLDELPTEKTLSNPTLEALQELYRCAKSMNGIDHMRLCAYYVVNSHHCDCGLQHLRLATAQYEVAFGQLETTQHEASSVNAGIIA